MLYFMNAYTHALIQPYIHVEKTCAAILKRIQIRQRMCLTTFKKHSNCLKMHIHYIKTISWTHAGNTINPFKMEHWIKKMQWAEILIQIKWGQQRILLSTTKNPFANSKESFYQQQRTFRLLLSIFSSTAENPLSTAENLFVRCNIQPSQSNRHAVHTS